MRSDVIFNFMKEEWYDQRRMLLRYFIISIAIEILVIFFSQTEGVLNWITQAGISLGELSMISFALLFIPYAVCWLILCNRTDRENQAGFYPLLHTLPITAKEIVTAKYISSFLLSTLMVGWLCGLWWVYEVYFPDAASFRGWTALCAVAFFYAFTVLAIQLGIFFRWGSSNLAFIFVLLLFAVSQFEFVGQLAELSITMMENHPPMIWGITILVTVSIWIICWRWSMKTYDKYISK